ncbi:MAG: alkaline phosphatase family protein [Anaerolineae bacterium]|nr:alkaline phosphatase family protein [Anaerolineae bacterium]
MNLHPSFIAPQYGGHCFADIPATIQYWLTGQGAPGLAPDVLGEYSGQYDLVISLFVDSLGWELLQTYSYENAFFQRLHRDGRVTKITSQFPSTTAAHVTCIHTGLPVGQSGVFEWQYYEPTLDAVITPLLFSYAGTTQRDQLKKDGVDPKSLYPNQTLYQALARQGVTSFTFGWQPFTPSTYSSVVMHGSQMRPFLPLTEGLLGLAAHAKNAHAPTYMFFYYGEIDTMCHQHGPGSVEARAQIETFAHAMERWFLPYVKNLGKRALLVMYADHGHMSVTPANTRYLNTHSDLRGILPMLRTDKKGNLLVPAGSPRDPFVYVREECLQEAHEFLTEKLEGYADVVKTTDLIAAGYFGTVPVSAALLGRIGNLAVLPYPENCVWWYEEDRFVQKYLGHHGGLTAREMEIPLALLEL